MPRVHVSRHLYRFFPVLEGRDLVVEGETVADVVRSMEALAPGFAGYVTDERGCLRIHVNVFVGEERVVDRKRLTDRVPDDATVHIFQALSGG